MESHQISSTNMKNGSDSDDICCPPPTPKLTPVDFKTDASCANFKFEQDLKSRNQLNET